MAEVSKMRQSALQDHSSSAASIALLARAQLRLQPGNEPSAANEGNT